MGSFPVSVPSLNPHLVSHSYRSYSGKRAVISRETIVENFNLDDFDGIDFSKLDENMNAEMPEGTEDALRRVAMAAGAIALFYRTLTDMGIPPEYAHEMTMAYMGMLAAGSMAEMMQDAKGNAEEE